MFTALGAASRVSRRDQIWPAGQLPADTVRVWGYPRYAVRSAAEQTVRAIVRSVDPRYEARFKARREWLVALGFLKGNRLAHLRSRSS